MINRILNFDSTISIGYKYYKFGSADSLDIDILVDHPKSTGEESDMELVKELKSQNPEINDWNINVIKIENGKVIHSIPSKGAIDSVNNSLFETYALHEQQFPFPLNGLQERNILLAVVKCIKSLLVAFKRTNSNDYYVKTIRPVLKSGSFKEAMNLILDLDFEIPFYTDKRKNFDLYKSIAFRIGQTLSLFDGIEIYTKEKFRNIYPELIPIINREEVDINPLFKKIIFCLFEKINSSEIYCIKDGDLQNHIDRIDFKTERITISRD